MAEEVVLMKGNEAIAIRHRKVSPTLQVQNFLVWL